MREALLLDLGAIVFELHRQSRREPDLLQAKATELRAVDQEVRELAESLEEGVATPTLTARGLVATCTGCGKLMGTRDRFCPSCGASAGAPAPELVEEPDFGDTIEAAALNGDAEGQRAEEQRAETDEAAEEPDAASGNRLPEAGAESTIPIPRVDSAIALSQRKMRAGRRMARQWLEQRRSVGR